MNPHLTLLLKLLNAKRERSDALDRNTLIHALSLISAPYSLEAVATYCGRLASLVDSHPGLDLQQIPDFDKRVAVLREVARIALHDAHFGRSHHRVDSPTPLAPYTGDGPICDVLLLLARREEDQPAFERITVWFVWLCLLYHDKTLPLKVYARYINGEEGSANRLKTLVGSARIAAAGCEIRKLADPDRQKERDTMCSLGLQLTEEHGGYLAQLAQQVHRMPKIAPHVESHWSKRTGLALAEASSQLRAMREGVPGPIRHVLRILWSRYANGRSGSERRIWANRQRGKYAHPQVRRYGQLRQQIQTVGSGAQHGDDSGADERRDEDGGIIVSVDKPVTSPAKARNQPPDAWVDDAEDPDDGGGDGLFHIYIAKRGDDHVHAYYAAKGLRNVVEYQNAKLPWSRDRLGSHAVSRLLAALRLDERDDAERRAAKLIILLSLLTGRSIDAVQKSRVLGSVSEAEGDEEIVVSAPGYYLRVRAAKPSLSKPKHPPASLMHDSADWLSVTLPTLAAELVGDGRWLRTRQLRLASYRAAAKRLLQQLPPHLAITPKAVSDALEFAIMALNGGDLGMVKVITDRQSLNFNNLIHYAAYPVEKVNAAWAGALSRLLRCSVGRHVGEATVCEKATSSTYVGTPDAINKQRVHDELARLRSRLHEHLAVDDPIRACNLLTLYTILWLNLATASRSRVEPAPLAIIGDSHIALISDKHRPDGSAERLVPLTDGVMAQLRSYVAYVWHLALRLPQLRPVISNFKTGVVRFQFINAKHEVVRYRPKWLYQDARLLPMPGNWARKLVRQELVEIGGRFLDAGMGHWVTGRHPYAITSNFAFSDFATRWLRGQQRLEDELGFAVVAHPQLREPPFEWPVADRLQAQEPAKKDRRKQNSDVSEADFELACREADEELFEKIEVGKGSPPEAVASLLIKIGSRYGNDDRHARAMVEACCTSARKRWGVPVFAERPRPFFARSWLINRVALFNLSYFTTHALPAFDAELEHLPEAAASGPPNTEELGRFVMLCIWRQGLVTWPVLDAFISSYCTGGILATGKLLYVQSEVRCRRNGARMGRINYLEPYCQAYFVIERERLLVQLSPLLALDPRRRRSHIQSALRRYMQSLLGESLPKYGLLSRVLDAAQQYLLLHSSPVLAAYAAAEFETHDLDDAELRRLAGQPERSQIKQARTATDSREDQVTDVVSLPYHELSAGRDVVHRLSHRRSPYVGEMRRHIVQMKFDRPLERLLQAFALWFLRREIKANGGKAKLSEKRRFEKTVEVIGYSLLGLGSSASNHPVISEAFLVDIEEQFGDVHPNVDSANAFQLLRRFLRQKSGRATVEKLGLKLGDVEPPEPRLVLAKLVATQASRQATGWIGRVDHSGIGDRSNRVAARRTMEWVALFGQRRSEIEHVREMDVQGDLVRIQPYGEHTLKTSWSERVLPKQLADLAGMEWVSSLDPDSAAQLIAHDLPRPVRGHNYYDAVNHLIQRSAGDPGVHLHTLRHDTASRLLLSVLSDAVDYDIIKSSFPWLEEFLAPREQIDVLLGGEGQSGHGLQAIAAMLGHSHPTTTLKHYIHTAGIAFYASLCGLPAINMMRSFEHRLSSHRTMQRRAQAWRDATRDMTATKARAYVQEQVVTLAEELCPGAVAREDDGGTSSPDAGVKSDGMQETVFDPHAISYERLIELEQIMRGEAPNLPQWDITGVRDALGRIYSIPSGKHGSNTFRHPADTVDGTKLPKRLPAKSPTQAAAMLCHWIENLRRKDPVTLDWLMDKWLYTTEKQCGRVRLEPGDLMMWQQLPTTSSVVPRIERQSYLGGPSRMTRTLTYGRIRCQWSDGKNIRRDVMPVRWVMTWVCALQMLQSGKRVELA